ncbi:chromate transporter [Paenibacillus sp. J2TS4]|nr:chromate transporter [Paenibacillus sp. J2TS4]
MIPVIEREIVTKRQWMDDKEMADVLSISGSAPGGIGVNAAIFTGFRLGKWGGAISALIGITLPTFLIVLALGAIFVQFRGIPKIEAAFAGIQSAIAALIVFAAYRLLRTAVLDVSTLLVAIGTAVLLLFSPVHPLILIVSGMLIGVVLIKVKERLGLKIKLDKASSRSKDEPSRTDRASYTSNDYFIGDGI